MELAGKLGLLGVIFTVVVDGLGMLIGTVTVAVSAEGPTPIVMPVVDVGTSAGHAGSDGCSRVLILQGALHTLCLLWLLWLLLIVNNAWMTLI